MVKPAKNTYIKNTLRQVFKTPGRMVSIILIIMMGVLLFVGIKAIGPNLDAAMDNYFKKHNLADIHIMAPQGFSPKDKAAIEDIGGAQVEFSYSLPFVDEEKNNTIQLFSYNSGAHHNKIKLQEGRLPTSDNEVVVDRRLKSHYPLNQPVTIKHPLLKEDSYVVTGYVDSPTFIANDERGLATTGSGQLDGFFMVPSSNFNLPFYNMATITYPSLTNKNAADYKKAVKQQTKQLEAVIDKNNYIITNKTTAPGFSDYEGLSSRIDVIGNVFPVFFFFIAGLITFTTMVRFVEENRQEMGTLKALGYKNQEIIIKYIFFAVLVGLLGWGVGVLIGVNLLPHAVFNMLKEQYIFDQYGTRYYAGPILLSLVATVLVTLGAALMALYGTLQEKPTSLLAQRAPKVGKTIWLEKIKILWDRLGFKQKITYRNIFRYKTRMVLTILGIAGCTALMLAGFGLRDSISATANKEIEKTIKYQAIVSVTNGLSPTQLQIIEDQFKSMANVTGFLPLYMDQLTIEEGQVPSQVANLYVISDLEATQLDNYFGMVTAANESIPLPTNGVVVGQKLANLFSLKKGSQVEATTKDGETVKFEVANVMKNYMGHYIVTATAYAKKMLNHSHLETNAFLVKLKDVSANKEQQFAKKLIATPGVTGVVLTSSMIDKQERMAASISPVVWIFIILSGVLAFVVLYNLTAINILERQRELSTLRVLGFYNNEVTMYIVRESIIFTIIGILLGFLIGNVLTWFILEVASSDQLAFPFVIGWPGYVFAALGTILFTTIVSITTHFKLRHVDMLKALKAND